MIQQAPTTDNAVLAGVTLPAASTSEKPIRTKGTTPPAESAATLQQSPPPTREELWSKCKHIAVAKDILRDLVTELGKAGFAGEERASKLIYLALTTRLFDDPVSAAIKGPSSGGKSHTVGQTLKFFPAEAFHELSSMSEKSLAYLDVDMRHRHLIICEAAGMKGETASYLIRTLLSEGFIKHATVENVDGELKSKELFVEGPIGLLTTTTLPSLHPENETRMLSIPINDTPEQTRRVMKAIALGKKNAIQTADWIDFQRWIALGKNDVVIPFIEDLVDNIDPEAIRMRRDCTKLFNLVKAHTLLHQATRSRTPDGEVIAEPEDYVAVWELVHDLFAETSQVSVSEIVRETVDAVARLRPPYPDSGVSLHVLSAELGRHKSVVSRRVEQALAAGYLGNLEDHQGRPMKLYLNEPMPEEREVLPHPDKLFGVKDID